MNPGVFEGPAGDARCVDGVDNDCDDTNPLVNLGVSEGTLSGNCADGLDNDCDTATDGADFGCGLVAATTWIEQLTCVSQYPGFGYVMDIVRRQNGNLVISGTTRFPQTNWIVKMDASSGNLLWQKILPNDARAIAGLRDGGLVAISGSQMIKLDTNGNVIWVKEILGASGYVFRTVLEASSGDLVVGAGSVSVNESSVVFTTNSAGEILWQKTIRSEYITFSEIAFASNGDLLIVGSVSDRLWVARFNGLQPEILWETRSDTGNPGTAIAGLTDGTIAVACPGAWLLRLNASGWIDGACSYLARTTHPLVDAGFSVTDSSAVITDAALDNRNLSLNVRPPTTPMTFICPR